MIWLADVIYILFLCGSIAYVAYSWGVYVGRDGQGRLDVHRQRRQDAADRRLYHDDAMGDVAPQ